ncbi:hypothetical protein F4780DRAFT_776823 [Xylariomycetidae sp. FL0641]|nr:hypothetical protein F4780DRAFT_776823 [Xylariomycetidae sp. FL0641]
MNFELPADLQAYIAKLDDFIRDEILPIQRADDNERFFDHRREPSRTQWTNEGLPTPEWEALLARARHAADAAGFYRFALPAAYGGRGPRYGDGLGLATQAADTAIQVFGADGCSRHQPFEHIWRHFRRYRITEGSEEVQMRKVAGYLFGYKNTGKDEAEAKNSKDSKL